MEYKPATTKERGEFYPVVRFWSKGVSDRYILNTPAPTRGRALQMAKKYIKHIKKN